MRAAVILLLAVPSAAQPFADRVIDYTPAPGQFVGDPDFNDPSRALGAPETLPDPAILDVVTLGGLGGSITLGMPMTVLDDPRNRLGLDAIVFGNAFTLGGDPTRRFAEPGLIEISLDVNGNGLADDPFYPIAGSHGISLPLPSELNGPVIEPPIGFPTDRDFIFGYADASPRAPLPLGGDPELFYTMPDDPTSIGIDTLPDATGTAGGDAFDIRWAIDPLTGDRAELPGFDFIRITTGVDVPTGIFGEVSTEIDAVADARPPCPADANLDGMLSPSDFGAWVAAYNSSSVVADTNLDGAVTPADFGAWVAGYNAGCP